MHMKLAALAAIGAGALLAPNAASAVPLRPAGIEVPSNIETIQNRRGFYRHGGRHYYNGHRGSRVYRRGFRNYGGWWFPGAAFATGAIIGGAIASQAAPVVVAPPAYGGGYAGGGDAHVQWCSQQYRSYDPQTDTFQPYEGPRRPCVSPY